MRLLRLTCLWTVPCAQTVAPILSIGSASLVAISTLTSEINFYTRLVRHGEAVCAHMRDLTGAPTQIKMVDPDTDRPLFQTRCIELACEACIADGKGHECVHRLHLVPQWQSAERYRKLRVMMQDRPDLIQRYAKHTCMVFIHVSLLCLDSYIKKLATRSELAGLAFDSLQQVFRKGDIKIALSISPLAFVDHQTVFLIIDPVSVPTQTCLPADTRRGWSSRVLYCGRRARGSVGSTHAFGTVRRRRAGRRATTRSCRSCGSAGR